MYCYYYHKCENTESFTYYSGNYFLFLISLNILVYDSMLGVSIEVTDIKKTTVYKKYACTYVVTPSPSPTLHKASAH